MALIPVQPAVPLPTTIIVDVDEEQTILAGQFVYKDGTSGRVKVATAGTTKLLGVAAHDVTTGADETAKLVVWKADDINKFYISPDDDALEALAGGAQIDLVVDETDIHLADVGESTTDVFEVEGKDPRTEWGSTDTRLIVKVTASKRQV
jgi:hypothetical protein